MINKNNIMLYGGSAIIVTVSMLVIKGVTYLFTRAIVTILQ